MIDFQNIKKSFDLKINKMLIPCTQVSSVEEWNHVLEQIKQIDKLKETHFSRTQSGGICNNLSIIWRQMPGYEITKTRSGCEILVLSYEIGHCRIQFRPTSATDAKELNLIQGRQAFHKFEVDCKKRGIDLEKYALPEEVGLEIKKDIEPPHIDILSNMFINNTFYNVHHLDINSSYPAGLAETHPEFYELIQFYYEQRKESRDYKAILNLTIGFMQSPYIKYKYAQLSRDAIMVNNRKVENMTNWLIKNERTVISRNTDGIWFCGESCRNIYNSKLLGEWHEDHTNCKFRIRSPGAYEYVEDGIYHPVVRGKTKLDDAKPRIEWEWGDIYHNDAIKIIKYKVTESGYLEEE